MPPDAEKLRQRSSKAVVGNNETIATNNNNNNRSLSNLTTHEVCIDGTIYDISNFDHPGGDAIQLFGGNDVTIQYNMIHPYHTSKHLEKMPVVGKVSDYTTEYKFDTDFEREIKREVFQIVRRGREFATLGYWTRALFYIALYFGLQYVWLSTGPTYTLAVLYGIAQALIGMNVQHDANHGAVSGKRPFFNDLLGLGADFIGGSKWLWMEQHWTHHAYTNHKDKDPDSFSGEPLFVWNDYSLDHPSRHFHHKFQGLYYLFVLSLYWVSAVFNPQILDLRQRGAQQVGMQMESPFIKSRRKYAIALRLLYIYVHVVHPIYYFGFRQSIGPILVLGFSESLFLAVLFSLSHNFVHADRDPTQPTKHDRDGKVCWFKSQVETSCTYGGFLSGCVTGGLNFQVEHHLFPRMSSAWYPFIAPTIRKICAKHKVRYVYYPWVHQNLWSTILYMHRAGTGWNWRDGNPYTGKL